MGNGNADVVVRLDAVGLRYGTGPEILHGIDFALERGSFHFLTGASGSGKTSLLRILYLALAPSSGLVTLLGRSAERLDRSERAALRRRIGVIFQEFRLLPHLDVLANVMLPLRIAGRDEAEARANAGQILDWVGLGDRARALPDELSGGEQQRAAIARAVVSGPELILADEPTGNLDPEAAARVMFLIERLNGLGTTVLVATHDLGLVAARPYPRLHLSEGRLAGSGPGDAGDAGDDARPAGRAAATA
jgi:cell division transport system ATP-binding protein